MLAWLRAEHCGALLAAARSREVYVFQTPGPGPRGFEALLAGPTLLLREVARDLPEDLGAPLARAADLFRRPRPSPRLRHARGVLDLARPVVMGIVNVTPDSFSDGGLFLETAAATEHARRLVAEGAGVIDVGGESTRPGSEPVPVEEELRRVLPVVEALAPLGVPLSIDTRKPEVARRALEAGAAIVNDVGGLRDPQMIAVAARAQAAVIALHMRGTPADMQKDPRYFDLLGEVTEFLAAAAERAERGGILPEAIAVDPGIGFGKTLEHNLALLARLDEIALLARPVVVGVSRKRFLGALTGRDTSGRLSGGLAATAIAVLRGASIVRTHDVRETVDAVAVAAGIAGLPSAGR